MSNFRNPSPAALEEFNKIIEFNCELTGYLVALFRYLRAKRCKYISQDDIDYMEFLMQLKYDRLYIIDPERTLLEVPNVDDIVWW